ncbi:hypothetical protein OPV22_003118 [Ensete ventricosum]|uniref:Uncharacterized protein n=1 Tax=Ensete ventricosum TaxID=4639 RepID=A0AAV8RZY5_ENSVE|nr:hypothetical protein OPV22_003118 [Ensete ventricosum]
MGIAISVLGKLGLPGVDSLSTDQVYKKYFGNKNIKKYEDFHLAFVDLCSDFNLVMPGRHFTIQASEIRVFYDSKWTKVPADTDGESKRKALLVEFMKDRVKEYKTSSRAMMVTGATAPPAAILIKKSGEKVPQLKMLRIDLIPDVVFVPAFTVLSLIGVRILNVTRTTRDTP